MSIFQEYDLSKFVYRLAGDYESLVGGNAKDALVDMTGGVGERVDLTEYQSADQKKELFRILKQSKENHSLIGASIAVKCSLLLAPFFRVFIDQTDDSK